MALINTHLEGGINGLYAGLTRGLLLKDSTFRATQTALLLLQVSGAIEVCKAQGDRGEGAFLITSKMGIFGVETLTVYTHPIGKSNIRAADVNPSAISRDDLVGSIAKEFYVLRIAGSEFMGGRMGVAADDYHFVVQFKSTTRGKQGDLALIENYKPAPPPADGTPLNTLQLTLGASLRDVVLRPLR